MRYLPLSDTDRSVDYSEEKVTARERAFYGSLSGWWMLGGILTLIAVVGILSFAGTFGCTKKNIALVLTSETGAKSFSVS